MADNVVGRITYVVDFETGEAIKAEASVDKASKKIAESFEKAEKKITESAKKVNKGFDDLTKKTESVSYSFSRIEKASSDTVKPVSEVSKEVGELGAKAAPTSDKIEKLANESGKLKTQVTGTAQAVNRGLNQALTNTSYQIQDIAVQLAGGQNPFLVMAQQIPQLLVGMGAMAAAIGAVVAVAGGLSMALIDTSTNAEKLQSSIDSIQAAITLGANGIANYTEEMERLNALSENLGRIKLALAINETANALSAAGKQIRDMRNDMFGFQEDSDSVAQRLTGLAGNAQQIIGLANAMQRFNTAASDEQRLKALSDTEQIILSFVDSEGKFPTQELADLAAEFLPLAQNTRTAIELNKQLKQGNEENTTAFENARIALKQQTIELEQGERQALKYSMLMSGDFTAAQIEALLSIYDTNQAIKNQREENDKLLDQFAEFEQWDEKQRQSRERAKGQAEGFATGVINRGMSEPERFAAELERLTELREQGLLSEDLYNQAIVASAEQRAQRLEEIAAQEEALRYQQNSMILGSASDLFGGIADIMKNAQGEQSSAYKAFFALSKGFAIAQAGLNLSTAISNALAIPFPANIPAMAQAAAAGTSLLGAINGAQYAGAREFGGPVTAGKSYIVGEKGREVFTPNTSGTITSNKDLMSGGGVNVNVYNYGNDNVQVKQNGRDVDIIIKQVVNTVAGQINSGQGPVGKALKGAGVKVSAIGG